MEFLFGFVMAFDFLNCIYYAKRNTLKSSGSPPIAVITPLHITFKIGAHTSDPFKGRVDSKKLEYGFRVIYAAFLSFLQFGITGRSYSNFLWLLL